MRPVGRGIEVSVLGERILKSGAKKHSLEIRCLTVYDMAFIFPIIVGGREVQVAAEALDLGIEARYPAVKTASGNAGLIVGGEPCPTTKSRTSGCTRKLTVRLAMVVSSP